MVHRFVALLGRFISVFTLAVGLAGCGNKKAKEPEVWSSRKYFPVGSTAVLPKGGDWNLVSAPADNHNQLFRENGRTLFVPHTSGSYEFEQAGTGQRHRLDAVLASTLPFYNLNYYPTRAMEVDGEGLWVLSLLRPEVFWVDRASLQPQFAIAVGSWPVAQARIPGGPLLVVAARGEDTLTIVDVEARRAIRSVFIGDEVSNVLVTRDGQWAFALAPNEREVVFVRTQDWTIEKRLHVGLDPTYLALDSTESKLYVAGRRTGLHSDASGADVSEIDVAAGAVARTIVEVGTTLGGLTLSADGQKLYVAALRNTEKADQAQPEGEFHHHGIAVYDLKEVQPKEVLWKDLSEKPTHLASTQKRIISLHAPVLKDSELWVLSEANDWLVRLDASTLVELQRSSAPGRPRSLVVDPQGSGYAFGHQLQAITEVTGGSVRTSIIGEDPRPPDVARGQLHFTGAGEYVQAQGRVVEGDRWSCNTCHADGASDLMIWRAGPSPLHRYVSRPYVLLQGSWPLGWQGYLSNINNYAHTVNSNIGIMLPTTEQVTGLSAYLASLMAPPRANGRTERDGALSELASQGESLFREHCSRCHAGPLTTHRGRALGTDGKVSDVPSLIGTYRHGVWLRTGAAKTLADAVLAMQGPEFAIFSFSEQETGQLTRYLEELTLREFFPLNVLPHPIESSSVPLPLGASLTVSFSHSVAPDSENLSHVHLLDANLNSVPARVTAQGSEIVISPGALLEPNTEYRLRIDAGFSSLADLSTRTPFEFSYKTVAVPTLQVQGSYVLSYTPASFSPGRPAVELRFQLETRWNGDGSVAVVAHYNAAPMVWTGAAVVSGERLYLPSMPIPAGDSFAECFSGFVADLTDSDRDGTADTVTEGTGPNGTRVYTMSGPGFEYTGLPWSLARLQSSGTLHPPLR